MTSLSKLVAPLTVLFLPFVPVVAAPDFDVDAAFKALPSSGASELRIPPGRYLLPKGGLSLKGVKNTTLHAAGVTFVATDLNASALHLQGCENVTITGLTLDYDPLPFTQGTITAVNREAGTVDFEVHAGYPELSEALLAERQFHLFEKDRARWKPGAPDYYPKKIEALTPTTGRVTFGAGAKGLDRIEIGDRAVLAVRKKSAVNVRDGCKGLRWEDVTLHAAPGIGFLVRFAEEAGTYQQVRVVPGPRPAGATEDRLLSTSADAFNAAYTRKGPVIEKCEFSFMGDDGINLHGVMLPVLKWVDDRTFLSMRPHRGDPFERLIRPGDEVRFLKEPAYAVTAVGKVESIALASESPAVWAEMARKIWPTVRDSSSAAFYQIRLAAPVSGVVPGDFSEVPALAAPGFVMRDSYFHDHRARSLRIMSVDGVVENNRIERIKGPAITLGGEFAFWREAGWCRNVVVRGNRITDVGQGDNILWRDSYTPGAISIMARVVPEGAATRYFPGNENIVLADNVIDGCSVSGIHVVAARRVKISNNTLRRVNQVEAPQVSADYGLESKEPICIIQAEAEVIGN